MDLSSKGRLRESAERRRSKNPRILRTSLIEGPKSYVLPDAVVDTINTL